MGDGLIVREDYPTPQVRLDLWGGTPGSYAGLDRFGRVTDQQWRNYNAGVDRDRFKYGYDRASNRTYREDTRAASGGGAFDHFYAYDALHRLTDSQRGTLNATKDAIAGGTLAFEQQWTLDAVGNWGTFKQDDNGRRARNDAKPLPFHGVISCTHLRAVRKGVRKGYSQPGLSLKKALRAQSRSLAFEL